jgi:hypothetical protein
MSAMMCFLIHRLEDYPAVSTISRPSDSLAWVLKQLGSWKPLLLEQARVQRCLSIPPDDPCFKQLLWLLGIWVLKAAGVLAAGHSGVVHDLAQPILAKEVKNSKQHRLFFSVEELTDGFLSVFTFAQAGEAAATDSPRNDYISQRWLTPLSRAFDDAQLSLRMIPFLPSVKASFAQLLPWGRLPTPSERGDVITKVLRQLLDLIRPQPADGEDYPLERYQAEWLLWLNLYWTREPETEVVAGATWQSPCCR